MPRISDPQEPNGLKNLESKKHALFRNRVGLVSTCFQLSTTTRRLDLSPKVFARVNPDASQWIGGGGQGSHRSAIARTKRIGVDARRERIFMANVVGVVTFRISEAAGSGLNRRSSDEKTHQRQQKMKHVKNFHQNGFCRTFLKVAPA